MLLFFKALSPRELLKAFCTLYSVISGNGNGTRNFDDCFGISERSTGAGSRNSLCCKALTFSLFSL